MGHPDLYRLFFEESGDALIALNLDDHKILEINRSFCGLVGFQRDEIIGETISFLNSFQVESTNQERGLDISIFEMPGYYNDIAIQTREHEIRYLTVKVSHAELQGKKIALAVLSDDTERLLLIRDLATKHYSLETAYIELEKIHSELQSTQKKMFQASKLVALGELAAGVSHELNQPLTGVKGFAQEIADIIKNSNFKEKILLEELCTHIVHNSDKMASLLAHLRTFAREERRNTTYPDESTKKTTLQQPLFNVLKLFDTQLNSKNIRADVRGELESCTVWAQAHPLEQILINLIANSRDAILERRIQDKNLRGHILINVSELKETVEIRVSDNGCGVPASIADQIFNPFFTTKDPNKGMGLGLSLSFSIAHSFGGELALESTSHSGSTFLLRLQNAKFPLILKEAA